MKALLPVFCRPLGYVILVISMFIPFLLLMQGMVTYYFIKSVLNC